MRYHTILFDLDGTLTDPGVGITNSVMYALQKYGIEVEDRSTLYSFIGPPLLDSFADRYGFSAEKSREATAYYREYYAHTGIYENTVYAGMEALLQHLREQGLRLAVATSKPEPFAVQILEHFGLAKYFDYIAGSTMDETRTNKAEVIAYALETLGVCDRQGVLMVGDRKYDVLGARQCGIDCMGVLFGYGSRQELEDTGAGYIARTVEEIADIIMTV